MHSRRLQTALTKFIDAAASHLQAAIDSGAEVPFELGSRTGRGGRGATPLYCYHALTGEFIAERAHELERLPGHAQAVKLLEGFEGLDRYLASVGKGLETRAIPPRPSPGPASGPMPRSGRCSRTCSTSRATSRFVPSVCKRRLSGLNRPRWRARAR